MENDFALAKSNMVYRVAQIKLLQARKCYILKTISHFTAKFIELLWHSSVHFYTNQFICIIIHKGMGVQSGTIKTLDSENVEIAVGIFRYVLYNSRYAWGDKIPPPPQLPANVTKKLLPGQGLMSWS